MLLDFVRGLFRAEPTHEEVFDAYIDLFNICIGDPPLRIYDESMLPYPKKKILAVLIKKLGANRSPEIQESLIVSIAYLANFQRGVGKSPIDKMPAEIRAKLEADKSPKNIKMIAKEISNFYEINGKKIDKFRTLVSNETDSLYSIIYTVTGRDIREEAEKFKTELHK